MKYEDMDKVLLALQAEEREVRKQGHAEYAHEEDNTFANFDRVAADLGLTREQVLWTYARKHVDGIVAWIRGHRSQREDVRGRILDLRMYLALLAGMVEEAEREQEIRAYHETVHAVERTGITEGEKYVRSPFPCGGAGCTNARCPSCMGNSW